ncbi:MAG: hypothetical protein IAF58_07720, partial [Leptolyngbya sp.]|nr:hypothetical protein [Candidatus Melainabacteria bacterium]
MLSTPLTFIELSIVFIPILAIALAKLLHSDSQKLKVYLYGQWFAFALSIFGFAFYLLTPNQSFSSVMPTPFEIKIDFLAVCLTVLVTFISSVVVAFSERYLLGTKTRTNFIQIVTLITPLASLLVTSNNLILCAICWHGISLVLWKLIGLRAEARGQARVVLFHHLLSDALMAIAVATLIYYCQTATITELYTRSSVLEKQVFLFGTPLAVPLSSIVNLLLIISMSIKSALFPFHRWLLATLEAPTPLSGILHAGVVNISAIMAARLFPILQESPSLLILWGLFSAVSAVVGTLIMSTQSDVKRKLVYSTVGQMGFMCLQCASGLIPAAIFHLIAHGLFKCHLFLQSGSAVSEGRAKRQWG